VTTDPEFLSWADAGFENVDGAKDAEPPSRRERKAQAKRLRRDRLAAERERATPVYSPAMAEFWQGWRDGFVAFAKFLAVCLIVGFIANAIFFNPAPHRAPRQSSIPAARPYVLPAAAKMKGHPCTSRVGDGQIVFTGCRTRYR